MDEKSFDLFGAENLRVMGRQKALEMERKAENYVAFTLIRLCTAHGAVKHRLPFGRGYWADLDITAAGTKHSCLLGLIQVWKKRSVFEGLEGIKAYL